MANYHCGCSFDDHACGSCCASAFSNHNWCSGCFNGIEADFLPCCCEQSTVREGYNSCGCRSGSRYTSCCCENESS